MLAVAHLCGAAGVQQQVSPLLQQAPRGGAVASRKHAWGGQGVNGRGAEQVVATSWGMAPAHNSPQQPQRNRSASQHPPSLMPSAPSMHSAPVLNARPQPLPATCPHRGWLCCGCHAASTWAAQGGRAAAAGEQGSRGCAHAGVCTCRGCAHAGRRRCGTLCMARRSEAQHTSCDRQSVLMKKSAAGHWARYSAGSLSHAVSAPGQGAEGGRRWAVGSAAGTPRLRAVVHAGGRAVPARRQGAPNRRAHRLQTDAQNKHASGQAAHQSR